MADLPSDFWSGWIAAVTVVSTVVDAVLTDVHVVDGDVVDGAITPGAVTPIDPVHAGAVTAVGAAKVFVTYNGVEKGL